MLTVQTIMPAGSWERPTAADTITLGYDERHRRRFHYTAAGGTRFLLDLPRPRLLQDGEGLCLSDGRIIAVEAARERLMEARADDQRALLRLAWHIGNRHLPAEITADGIRLRHDHVIHKMLTGLGARVLDIDAAFSPEQGAYAEAHGADTSSATAAHASEASHHHHHHAHEGHDHEHA